MLSTQDSLCRPYQARADGSWRPLRHGVGAGSGAMRRSGTSPGRRGPRRRAGVGLVDLLNKIQQKAHDEARFMPKWEAALLYA